ncbi:Uncharacterized protein GBIM_08922 [Gryllus bimaculatus]|nr:Uncharacterized protein GBIM_08922 [Gryllus bimaculatus]
MAGQQICLKWNSFQANIVTSFENLWEEEGLVDVTLASDGQCLRAHKTNPCQHPVIILQDVHFTELESLLCFVYKGEVNIEQENLPALLRAAETLQIRGLSGASEQVKEKMGASKKVLPPNSPEDSPEESPPVKRPRSIQPSQSPPLPTTPLALTPTSRPSRSRHPSTSSVEPWEQPQQPGDPEIPPKVEPSDSVSRSPSPLHDALEDSTDGSVGPPCDLMQAQLKLPASDTGQIKGEGDAALGLNLPYQNLPYACLLPRAQVLATWAKARTLEQLACDLMKILFTTDERILCNVNGKMGKRQFNVHKIQLIREVLHFFSNLPAAEFEEQWKSCVTKIDTANRGLKRNLIRTDVNIIGLLKDIVLKATEEQCNVVLEDALVFLLILCMHFEKGQLLCMLNFGILNPDAAAFHAEPNDAPQANKNFPFPPFPCPFCDRAYTSWGFRRRHIKAMHTQSPRLSCKWCLRVLPSHSDWEQHVMAEHNLSPGDAHNGLLILEEAHMVLQIPNPTRLDTFVSMIRKSGSNSEGEKSSASISAQSHRDQSSH